MNTRQALIEEICASPEDDGPRLVFADWLEEHNYLARAEFIRIQCRLAELGPPSDFSTGEPWCELQERQKVLMNGNRKLWARPLKQSRIAEFQFRRGFLESIGANVARRLSAVSLLFSEMPTIRKLRLNELNTMGQFVAGALRVPELLRVDTLDIGNSQLNAKLCHEICSSEFLRNIETLRISKNPIHIQGLHSILCESGFSSLRHLDIGDADFGDVMPSQLIHSFDNERARNLETLDIERIKCKKMNLLNTLFPAVHLPSLKTLRVWHDDHLNSAPNLAPFLDSQAFKSVENFLLHGCWSKIDLEMLLNHPNANNIQRLDLGGWQHRFIDSLVSSESIWTSLRYLNLQGACSNTTLKTILTCEKFSGLDWLAIPNLRQQKQEKLLLQIEETHGLKLRNSFNVTTIF